MSRHLDRGPQAGLRAGWIRASALAAALVFAAPVFAQAAAPCAFAPSTAPLQLSDAVQRALCHSADTRMAMAQLMQQEADEAAARAAYYPVITADTGIDRGRTRSNVSLNGVAFTQESAATTRAAQLDLSWLLYDFGGRAARLASAQQLLRGAGFAQQLVHQKVLFNTVQAYYALHAAEGRAVAAEAAEQAAARSLAAAQAKQLAGVGALADQQQAEAAYHLARLERLRAEGDRNTASGQLADSTGMTLGEPLKPAAQVLAPGQAQQVTAAVASLIEEALRNHPSLGAARAELAAAGARVAAVRSDGLPTLTLSAEATNSRNQATGGALQRKQVGVVGLQLNIPLFDGFLQSANLRAAQASQQFKQAQLELGERQVAIDVWQAWQALQTAGASLTAAQALDDSATRSYTTALGRYEAAVGSLLELLNAQRTWAGARQTGTQALSDWHVARVKLAFTLGRLSTQDLQQAGP